MRFQNVKAEELEGPVKLSGFSEWLKGRDPETTSVLLAAAPGTGKGAAIGSLANALHYDVVRCRLKQLLEYPDPIGEFKAMLQGAEHLHRTVLWLDGMDRFLHDAPGGGDTGSSVLENWLKSERQYLKKNEVIVVATARQPGNVPPAVTDAFDQAFS